MSTPEDHVATIIQNALDKKLVAWRKELEELEAIPDPSARIKELRDMIATAEGAKETNKERVVARPR